jgi:hypothetical protein
LKSNNNSYLKNFKLKDLDKSNLVCTLQKDELAEILSIEYDNENINKLTDYFNINCIRSINKLNHILVSEQIKLIFNIYVNLISNSENLLYIVHFCLRFHYNIIKAIFLLKELSKDSISLTNVCRLIKVTDIEDAKPTFNNKDQDESNLANYLRNALLNLNEINKLNDEMKDEKLKYFNMLKLNMDYCDFYFKQLTIKIDGSNCNKTNDGLYNLESSNELNLIDLNNDKNKLNEEPIQQVVVDEIYEADTYNLNDNINISTQEDEEMNLKEKKTNMANKNLMYELKYALKSKKNEWKLREKNAKRTIDENSKTVLEEYKNLTNCQPDDAFDTDYLLDNESSKYKSELRRRRYLYKIENKKEFKCQKKYAYSEEKDDKENKEDQVHNPKNISFLSELINKRNDLFSNNRNVNDFLNNDEEIIS